MCLFGHVLSIRANVLCVYVCVSVVRQCLVVDIIFRCCYDYDSLSSIVLRFGPGIFASGQTSLLPNPCRPERKSLSKGYTSSHQSLAFRNGQQLPAVVDLQLDEEVRF